MSDSILAKNIWLRYLKSKWPIYLLGAIAVFLTNIMQVLAPKIIGWIVDFFNQRPIPKLFIGANKEETFYRLFALLVFSRVFINVFRFFWRITLGRQTHYACGELRRDVWKHARFFKRQDLSTKFTKGILMNAQISDANSARFVFGFTLVAIFDLVFLGSFTFISMAMIHVKMALISFFVLLFVPFWVKSISQKEIEQYRVIQSVLGHFNDLCSQAVATVKLQRLTQTGVYWEKRLMESATKHREQKLVGANLALSYLPLWGVADLVSFIVLFFLGIHFTFKSQMTVGQFVSMQGLIFLLHDPLSTFGFVISEWKKAFTALERLSEIYHHPIDEGLVQVGIPLVEHEVILQADHLTFMYPDEKNNRFIFEDFKLTLKKGERLGIIGPIGSGKTTLLNILSGMERGHKGELLFLNRPMTSYAHRDLRKYIGLVHQKPFLFAESIRENISLGKEMNDEELWYYLDLAGMKEDVLAFPDKLDTSLGEWGINLSGGQKQRLTLCRALIQKPELLFLDDALSAVDIYTEEKILKNLDQHFKATTLVWVAHRTSTLKYCNRIIDMGIGHSDN